VWSVRDKSKVTGTCEHSHLSSHVPVIYDAAKSLILSISKGWRARWGKNKMKEYQRSYYLKNKAKILKQKRDMYRLEKGLKVK